MVYEEGLNFRLRLTVRSRHADEIADAWRGSPRHQAGGAAPETGARIYLQEDTEGPRWHLSSQGDDKEGMNASEVPFEGFGRIIAFSTAV